MNSISHGLDVYALHHRVGRGFQPNKLGLWRQKPQQIFQSFPVPELELDLEVVFQVTEVAEVAPIKVV